MTRMEFTRYMWQLYADSEQGRAALASSTESFLLGDSLPPLVRQAQLCERSADGNLDPIDNEFVEADVRDDVRTSLTEDKGDSADAARTLFTGIVDEGLLM